MITINKELTLDEYLKCAETAYKCPYSAPWEIIVKIFSLSTEITGSFLSGMNLENKRIMTMGSSLDQVFSYAILGSYDITVMDANNLTVPFLHMKLAALKVLDRKEFIAYFLNNCENSFMDNNIYLKFKDKMPNNYQMFWDTMYKKGYIKDIFQFYQTALDGELPIYLATDDYYNYIKQIVDKLNITINICELSKFPLYLEGEYDLIDLSNVYTYVNKEKYWNVVNELGQYLSINGIFKLHYDSLNVLNNFTLLDKKSFPKMVNKTDMVFILWENDESTYKIFQDQKKNSQIKK